MGRRIYLLGTATIFLAVALLHLLRVILGWSATIGGWDVPTWLSWVAFVIALALAASGFVLIRRR